MQANQATENTRFRILTEVSQQITSILDIDELLEQVVRLIQKTFDYYNVAIGLIEADEVVYRAGAGILWDKSDFQFKPARLKVGSEGITGWVAKTGQPALVPDVTRDTRYVWMQGSVTLSELIVPITVKGTTIGVLDVQSEQVDDFDQTDLEFMQSLANQTGIAIENARLFSSLQRRTEQFRVVTEVSQHVISLKSMDELLGNIARTVKESFGYLHVGIGLVEGKEVVSKAEAGAFEGIYRSIRIPLGQGIWGSVAQRGESLVSGPVSVDREHVHLEGAGIQSHVCVPLKVKDMVIGVMSAASDRPGAFDAGDEIILQTLANQTSVAIENVRLHEQEKRIAILEERQRLARELHDSVTQSLYGITLYSQAAAGHLALENYEQVDKLLDEINETSQEALAEMRLLIYQLRPPVLEKEGLLTALQARLAAVEGRAGLKTGLKTDLTARLPFAIEEGLYHIAQEALNNALKHAHARSVNVSLLQNGPVISLEIVDDGIGFEVASAYEEGKMGLPDMEDHASELGGRLTVVSEPGKGTRIRVDVYL
jgi:signal transduction histidine kinase